MVETEIFCHGCNKYFRVDFDRNKNGNHVVKCPHCKHEHCRVIENGRITSTRWDQRNGVTWHYVATTNTYSESTFVVYGSSSTTSASDNYPGAWTEWRSI
jgi:hypothetical protein